MGRKTTCVSLCDRFIRGRANGVGPMCAGSKLRLLKGKCLL